MNPNTPPRGFVATSHTLLETIATRDLERLRSLIKAMATLRDSSRDTPQEGWWNAALTVSQLANEFMSSAKSAAAVHVALDKNQRDARILVAIAKEPMNQSTLAEKLHDDEGNLSKALTDLEERGLVMRRRESRSKFIFLSPLGTSALETHRFHCRVGPPCLLLAQPRAQVAVAEPIFSAPPAPAASEARSALERKIAEMERKLREEHDKVAAASLRVRELRDLVAAKVEPHPMEIEVMTAAEQAAVELEARLLDMQARAMRGQAVSARELEPVVIEQLQEVERLIERPL